MPARCSGIYAFVSMKTFHWAYSMEAALSLHGCVMVAHVMTGTQVHCHLCFSTEEHLVCSQIRSKLWGSDLAIRTTFNPPLVQSSPTSVLSAGHLSSVSVPVFVISRFYQQILLTPTSFLIALSMAGSATVTCLPTSKLPTPSLLIRPC